MAGGKVIDKGCSWYSEENDKTKRTYRSSDESVNSTSQFKPESWAGLCGTIKGSSTVKARSTRRSTAGSESSSRGLSQWKRKIESSRWLARHDRTPRNGKWWWRKEMYWDRCHRWRVPTYLKVWAPVYVWQCQVTGEWPENDDGKVWCRGKRQGASRVDVAILYHWNSSRSICWNS
jgi:hypothetical protein